jgi:hypothetical protein
LQSCPDYRPIQYGNRIGCGLYVQFFKADGTLALKEGKSTGFFPGGASPDAGPAVCFVKCGEWGYELRSDDCEQRVREVIGSHEGDWAHATCTTNRSRRHDRLVDWKDWPAAVFCRLGRAGPRQRQKGLERMADTQRKPPARETTPVCSSAATRFPSHRDQRKMNWERRGRKAPFYIPSPVPRSPGTPRHRGEPTLLPRPERGARASAGGRNRCGGSV